MKKTKTAGAQTPRSAATPAYSDRFPSAFTILFALILIMAALTWIIPTGQYERTTNEALGRDTPVPGTYQVVESAPQTIVDAFFAPIAGFYDPQKWAPGPRHPTGLSRRHHWRQYPTGMECDPRGHPRRP